MADARPLGSERPVSVSEGLGWEADKPGIPSCCGCRCPPPRQRQEYRRWPLDMIDSWSGASHLAQQGGQCKHISKTHVPPGLEDSPTCGGLSLPKPMVADVMTA
jgi:hypothetical protein